MSRIVSDGQKELKNVKLLEAVELLLAVVLLKLFSGVFTVYLVLYLEDSRI